jgi:tartrate-resistant acid phosphatase type 5
MPMRANNVAKFPSPRRTRARLLILLTLGLLMLLLAPAHARPAHTGAPYAPSGRIAYAPTDTGRTIFLPLVRYPLQPPDDRPDYVRFAVIGDYGSGSERESSVSELVKSWNPGFVVTVGDNNYGPDKAANIDVRIGQFYAEYIFPYKGNYGGGAASNRFYPALGNHDWNADGLEAHLAYFKLPGNERYYEVARGPVRFFVLDSDEREPDGVTSTSMQGRWLQAALARSTSCWNLVLAHHAPFSSGDHGSSEWMQWPFPAWGADAVLAGHDHHYERLDMAGFPYFVNGLGGASRYSVDEQLPGSQVVYNDDFGAMVVVATRTSLDYKFYAIDGTLVDHFRQTGGCG